MSSLRVTLYNPLHCVRQRDPHQHLGLICLKTSGQVWIQTQTFQQDSYLYNNRSNDVRLSAAA